MKKCNLSLTVNVYNKNTAKRVLSLSLTHTRARARTRYK